MIDVYTQAHDLWEWDRNMIIRIQWGYGPTKRFTVTANGTIPNELRSLPVKETHMQEHNFCVLKVNKD